MSDVKKTTASSREKVLDSAVKKNKKLGIFDPILDARDIIKKLLSETGTVDASVIAEVTRKVQEALSKKMDEELTEDERLVFIEEAKVALQKVLACYVDVGSTKMLLSDLLKSPLVYDPTYDKVKEQIAKMYATILVLKSPKTFSKGAKEILSLVDMGARVLVQFPLEVLKDWTTWKGMDQDAILKKLFGTEPDRAKLMAEMLVVVITGISKGVKWTAKFQKGCSEGFKKMVQEIVDKYGIVTTPKGSSNAITISRILSIFAPLTAQVILRANVKPPCNTANLEEFYCFPGAASIVPAARWDTFLAWYKEFDLLIHSKNKD